MEHPRRINSLFGFQSSHGPSALSSPTEVPEENIRETENDKGATTTTYLVPRPVLPMLEPLDGVLPPPVISAANNGRVTAVAASAAE